MASAMCPVEKNSTSTPSPPQIKESRGCRWWILCFSDALYTEANKMDALSGQASERASTLMAAVFTRSQVTRSPPAPGVLTQQHMVPL